MLLFTKYNNGKFLMRVCVKFIQIVTLCTHILAHIGQLICVQRHSFYTIPPCVIADSHWRLFCAFLGLRLFTVNNGRGLILPQSSPSAEADDCSFQKFVLIQGKECICSITQMVHFYKWMLSFITIMHTYKYRHKLHCSFGD